VSPEIPSPGNTPRLPNIPETPRISLPKSSNRPLGSPVRGPMGMDHSALDHSVLDHSILDPALRLPSFTSQSIIDTESDLKSSTANDSDDEKTSIKTSSEPSQTLPSTKEASSRKAKKLKLTVETVEYEKDDRIRDSYYRTTTERMGDNLRILGIKTGCYGILYLQRYIILSFLINCLDR
jgi:hypothetical protein